jgi:N-glycosylase/DNA lyase
MPQSQINADNRFQAIFPATDYDLEATLNSGQAFRWRFQDGKWTGVVAGRWLRLQQSHDSIVAEVAAPVENWEWLVDYLQLQLDLRAVIQSFPDDAPLKAATLACRGLRLLRQEPWECLASFILSSTKQIVQIQQIVNLLCERFGDRIPALSPHAPAFTFPSPARIAALSEAELRDCKMGFRAPYLLESARLIDSGSLHLMRLRDVPVDVARTELMQLPGVGRKIADCVLLFAYGFPTAFPVDVWVMKALRSLYFPKRRPTTKRLLRFSQTYFGPNAGYAQQYLFHYMRTKARKPVL